MSFFFCKFFFLFSFLKNSFKLFHYFLCVLLSFLFHFIYLCFQPQIRTKWNSKNFIFTRKKWTFFCFGFFYFIAFCDICDMPFMCDRQMMKRKDGYPVHFYNRPDLWRAALKSHRNTNTELKSSSWCRDQNKKKHITISSSTSL